jgi:hypothetical protein
VALPATLLASIAVAQMALSTSTTLSAWKGGGFGMFSTVDAPAFRAVRVTVEAPGRSEIIELPPSLHDLGARAAAWPTTARLVRLARAIGGREQRQGRPVDLVRVEVARRDVASDGTVRATAIGTVSVGMTGVQGVARP